MLVLSMEQMPEHLKAAIAKFHRENPIRQPLDRAPQECDIVTVQVDNVTRLALVTKTYDTHLQLNLIHPYVEMATDFDLIVRGVMPYTIVAMGELYFVALYENIKSVWASIPDAQRVALMQGLWTDGESIEPFDRGMPLSVWNDDPRREFLRSELEDATVLRNPAHLVLLKGYWGDDD